MNTTKHLVMMGLAVAFVLGLTACGGSSSPQVSTPVPIPEPLPTPQPPAELDLQRLIDQAVDNGVVGVNLLVESSSLQFRGSAGLSNQQTLTPLLLDDIMPTGSAGKVITATLALMLQQDGLLDLDDRISTWLAPELLTQIPYGEQMTLRQLLNHTSGLFEYLHNPQFGEDLLADPDRIRLDADVIPYALNQPAYFEPGEGFQYSNSGYVLAGIILDKVLGYHHSIAVRERIIDPLGMVNTFYLGAEEGRRPIASGYRPLSDLELSDDDTIQDVKPLLYRLGVADAPLASTVEDYLLLQHALLDTGTLLSETSTDEFIGEGYRITIGSDYHLGGSQLDYGLGMFHEANSSHTLLHHNGDQFGWLTYNLYWQEKDMNIVMMVNCGGSVCEDQSAQIINAILTQ